MSGKEQVFIQEAFDTNWVVPLGPNVNGFEEDLKHFVGNNKEVVALSAGTAAVHLALLACGVGPGDEVIVQSFTFCASSHPVTYLRATPVFVDSGRILGDGPGVVGRTVRTACQAGKPKAIVPVYHAGCRRGERSWRLPTDMIFWLSKMPPKDWGAGMTDRFAVRSDNTSAFIQREQDDHYFRWWGFDLSGRRSEKKDHVLCYTGP